MIHPSGLPHPVRHKEDVCVVVLPWGYIEEFSVTSHDCVEFSLNERLRDMLPYHPATDDLAAPCRNLRLAIVVTIASSIA